MSDSDYPRVAERNEKGDVVAAIDWLGNTFRIGDQVVYCISAGRGQMLAIGKVLRFKCTTLEHMVYRPAVEGETANYRSEYNGEEFVRVRQLYDSVTVQVHTLKTSGRWNNKTRSKPAWVNPMNITAIPLKEIVV